MNLIGPKIKELRIENKLSQKDLAARCNVVGWDISRGTLAKIEVRVRSITDAEIVYLAKALGVEIGKLFEGLDTSSFAG